MIIVNKILPLVFLSAFILIAGDLFAENSFEYYQKLNNSEKRMPFYKDSDQMLLAKLAVLREINADRKANGLKEVELDILASRVANEHCLESAANNYMSHWNMAGLKPYQRYAQAGGVDHVMENCYSMYSTGALANDPASVQTMMLDGHKSFMSETAPNDGHRKNCLGKFHNYVGLGCAVVGGRMVFTQEFIDRYLQFVECQNIAAVNEKINLRVKPLDPSANYVYMVVVYYEPQPDKKTPSQLNSLGGYPDYSTVTAGSYAPWNLKPEEDGTVPLTFSFTKPGSYYVNIYLDKAPRAASNQANTAGKLQASGLVINVK